MATSNITVAENESDIDKGDNVYKFVDPGDIPKSGGSVDYVGYAPIGGNVVYLSTGTLYQDPASSGLFVGTGKTVAGEATMERTVAHETGHSYRRRER